jgi:hypothetical protein
MPSSPARATTPSTKANLEPRYNLATSAVDPDGHYNTTTYTQPWAGLAASSTVDAYWGGQNLTTSYTYEDASAGHYRRQLTKTLPAGNTWSYAYYGGTATPAGGPCGSGGIYQGGALKTRTGPAPAGGDRSGGGVRLRRDRQTARHPHRNGPVDLHHLRRPGTTTVEVDPRLRR